MNVFFALLAAAVSCAQLLYALKKQLIVVSPKTDKKISIAFFLINIVITVGPFFFG